MIKSTNISINKIPVLLKENKTKPIYDYQRPMGRGEPHWPKLYKFIIWGVSICKNRGVTCYSHPCRSTNYFWLLRCFKH